GPGLASPVVTSWHQLTVCGTMQAAEIAPANAIPQVVSTHDNCVEHGCQWLRYGCADAALPELVANWHRLSPSVGAAIMKTSRTAMLARRSFHRPYSPPYTDVPRRSRRERRSCRHGRAACRPRPARPIPRAASA